MSQEVRSRASVHSPLPYHQAICEYLQREEPQVWQWYASHRVQEQQAEALRLELLKATYRVDPEQQTSLYAAAREVASELGLDVPLTIYQAQDPLTLNASLAYVPDHAHVVLHGPIGSRLDEGELRALFAHELGHMLLYTLQEGKLLVAEQVLGALTRDRQAGPPHFAAARLFGLYTEVFCDRVAHTVTAGPEAMIRVLVKVATGLDQVDAASYVRQAEEIFAKGPLKTEGLSHPETYLRAWALHLWHQKRPDVDQQITELLEGPLDLDQLDLVAQQRVMQLTRRVIDEMLRPAWLRTDSLLAHARLFFDDYHPPGESDVGPLGREDLPRGASSFQDYLCFVLLDFAAADRELDEAPLAFALDLADRLGLEPRFGELAARELRLRKKQLEKIRDQRRDLIASAERQGASA